MITKIYNNSNILRDKAQAIVIPVNTIGIAGAGLAHQWARLYPQAAAVYRYACRARQLHIGKVILVKENGAAFICLPTKTIPQYASELRYVEQGLIALRQKLADWKIESIAVPALGCGLGRLPWKDVEALIEQYLDELEIPVHVYLPKSFPRRAM